MAIEGDIERFGSDDPRDFTIEDTGEELQEE